jgi:imidazolonepropionase-like amidohydrolase
VPTFAPVQKQVDHATIMGWSDEVISNLQRILDGHATSLVRAHEMGVTIIAGSDAGSYGVAHGVDFIYELELMERAGLSPIAVINAATGNSAGRLGYQEEFGRIEPGGLSRFIVADDSPRDGLSNLRKPKLVVFDGLAISNTPDDNLSGL